MLEVGNAAAPPPYGLTVGNFSKAELIEFLHKIYLLGCSDIKFSSTDFVWAEVNRVWQKVSNRRMDDQEAISVLHYLFNESGQTELGAGRAIDNRVELMVARGETIAFRMNGTACYVGTAANGVNITLRAMPQKIPTLTQLGTEPEIMEELFPRYGLVLIVGTTGSGKSTLLAAAHRWRLEERRWDPVHILTYEAPVEYILAGLAQGYMPEPTQTEVGRGAQLTALEMVGPNAMRRKGQVVQMGEIRDMDSARAGFELGATGHATYATMHTETPDRALSRTLQFFPPVEHPRVANDFMEQARLVIAQKLTRTKAGGVKAFRSWCIFDRELKRLCEPKPVQEWGNTIRKMVQDRGNNFEANAFQSFVDGEIDFGSFVDVASFTKGEAREYCAGHGVIVNEAGEPLRGLVAVGAVGTVGAVAAAGAADASPAANAAETEAEAEAA